MDSTLESADTVSATYRDRCEYWIAESDRKISRRLRDREEMSLVLTGHGLSLRVEKGSLLVRDGNTHYPAKQRQWRFFPGALDVPPSIVVLDGSGNVTLDAIDWLATQVLFDPIAQLPLSTHPTEGITFGFDDHRSRKPKSTKRSDRLHMLDTIYAGRLWAIGLQVLRGGSHELVRIPGEYFAYGEAKNRKDPLDRSEIRWGKCELTVSGMSYSDIRIFRVPNSENELVTAGGLGKLVPPKRNLAKKNHSERKLGRPASDPEIAKTAKRLWKTDLKFQTLPLKAMVLVVRANILGEQRRKEEIVGYKSSSMEKTISRALRPFRNPTKLNKRNKRSER